MNETWQETYRTRDTKSERERYREKERERDLKGRDIGVYTEKATQINTYRGHLVKLQTHRQTHIQTGAM